MISLWTAATQVKTGVTLVAFGVAVAAWLYRSSLSRQEHLIRSAAEGDRARLVENALEFFRVDTQDLTKEQQYQLALRQIRARERRFRVAAVVISLVAVLFAAVTAYAVARTTTAPNGDTTSNIDARQRLQDEIIFRLQPVKNLVRGDTLDPLVQAELSFVVFTSTPPSQHHFMVSQRRNVYAEYLDRNLESLFIELRGLVAEDERGDVERGRDAAHRFDDLLHRGPKREIELASHVSDDITVLTPAQIIAVRDTLIPSLRTWLH
jgi:hypothetical protein